MNKNAEEELVHGAFSDKFLQAQGTAMSCRNAFGEKAGFIATNGMLPEGYGTHRENADGSSFDTDVSGNPYLS